MKSNTFVLLLLILVLQGCAAFGPVPVDYHGPVVTLWDNVNKLSETNAHYFELIAVDGRGVIKSSSHTREKSFLVGFSMDALPLSRNIPVDSHILYIGGFNYLVADLFGLGDSFYRIKGNVKVSLEKGKSYMVNGELAENYSLVWVEDEKTGVIVSNILFEGSVQTDYLAKLKIDKINLLKKANQDLELKQKHEKQLFNNAINYIKDDGCDINKGPKISTLNVYIMAESLFSNKKFKESLRCFKSILKSNEVPVKTYHYLFLIYDVGLGVPENRKEAEFWKEKYKLLMHGQ